MELKEVNEVPYLYDKSGRIYLKNDRIYRIVEDKDQISNYENLLGSPEIENLFRNGLVRTKIWKKISPDGPLILEHKRIPFILHPAEYSNKMFWSAAITFIELNIMLWRKGFVTQDSHPYNMTFNDTVPVFFDFGSIVQKTEISQSWFEEFYTYFIVPIWLSNRTKSFKYSKEYRREHGTGFGLQIFKSKLIRRIFFRNFFKISHHKSEPEVFFNKILKWLKEHEPISVKPQYWSKYYKSEGMNFLNPSSIKQKFVFDILSEVKPKKVADLASNKGYYSLMAAHIGADVIAFDYEEEIIDSFFLGNNIYKNITPVHLDFVKPSPGSGPALFQESSFKRFKSDVVLALGLIHHVCITQGVPVFLFCKTCLKYATHGILLEFVDPTDKHVIQWKREIPKDYNIETIKKFIKQKFPLEVQRIDNSNGLNRRYLYFYK